MLGLHVPYFYYLGQPPSTKEDEDSDSHQVKKDTEEQETNPE